MITASLISENLGVPETQAAAALSQIDQSSAFAAARAAMTITVWDKTSPINGVDASTWLQREDVNPEAAIYLLHDGERLFFQPHVAGAQGYVWMTDADVMAHANDHADALAHEIADCKTYSAVMNAIGVNAAPLA